MYANILCATDGSDLGTKALTHALALAAKLGATVTVVTVTDPSVVIAPGAEAMIVDTSAVVADLDKVKATSARKILDDADALATKHGQAITGIHVDNSTAAEGILRAAKERHADLIVMGSHGRRGLGRLLLGSQAAEVLAHTDTPVLIIK